MTFEIVDAPDLTDIDTLIVVGRGARLGQADVRALVGSIPTSAWDDMVRRGDPGDAGRVATTYTGQAAPKRVAAAVLPEICSRHNTPSRAHAIPGLVKSVGGAASTLVVVALDDVGHAFASALAVARAFPSFSATARPPDRRARLAFLANEGPIDLARLRAACDALRSASALVDTPPDRANPDAIVAEAEQLAKTVGARVTLIRGKDLRDKGFGGLWNVGKASRWAPALVVLDHDVEGSRRVGWVGKGVTYDTGGLSIKGKLDMPGMKTDMAGAAAVLAAFGAAVKLGTRRSLTAVLCVAENAIGPEAMRPDDVITLYSGRTVEVNNTDAEGRLVLADGLAWLVKHRNPAEVIDLATLTGAQSAATGKRTAAIYCTDEGLEARAVLAGRSSGDTVHPLPYLPEFWRPEFASTVADLRNSVKDRGNGQSACAGQFLVENLGTFTAPFMHVDLASPAVGSNGRGTGFGVGLLLELLA